MNNWTEVLGDPSYSMIDRANSMLDALEYYMYVLQWDTQADEIRAVPRITEEDINKGRVLRGYGKYFDELSDELDRIGMAHFNALPHEQRMNNRNDFRFSEQQRQSQYALVTQFLPGRGVWKMWRALTKSHHLYSVMYRLQELELE